MNSLGDLAIRATFIVGAGLLGHRVLKHASAEVRSNVLRLTAASLAILPIGFVWGPKLDVVMPWIAKPEPIRIDASLLSMVSSDVPAPTAATPWLWPMIAWGAVATAVALRAWLVFRPLRKDWKTSQSITVRLQIEVLEALAKLKVNRHVDVRLSDVSTPLTYGVLRPRIVLPIGFEDWPREHRKAVLLHEAAHIKRFDCGWQWLSTALRAVYWCHPLVWPMSWSLRDEAELAADERVIRTGVEATDYASSLVAIARTLSLSRGVVRSQGVNFMNDHQLDKRVHGALAHRRRGFGLISSLGLMASAIATTLFGAGIRLQEPQPDVIIVQEEKSTIAEPPGLKAIRTVDETIPIDLVLDFQVKSDSKSKAKANKAKSKSNNQKVAAGVKVNFASTKLQKSDLIFYSVPLNFQNQGIDAKNFKAQKYPEFKGHSFQSAKYKALTFANVKATGSKFQGFVTTSPVAKNFQGFTVVGGVEIAPLYSTAVVAHPNSELKSAITYSVSLQGGQKEEEAKRQERAKREIEERMEVLDRQAAAADDAKRQAERTADRAQKDRAYKGNAQAVEEAKRREEVLAALYRAEKARSDANIDKKQAESELNRMRVERDIEIKQLGDQVRLQGGAEIQLRRARELERLAKLRGEKVVRLSMRDAETRLKAARALQTYQWDVKRSQYVLDSKGTTQVILIDANGRKRVVNVANGKTLTLKVGKNGKATVINPPKKK